MLKIKSISLGAFWGQVAVSATRRMFSRCNCPKYYLKAYMYSTNSASIGNIKVSQRYNPLLLTKFMPRTILMSSPKLVPRRNIAFLLKALRAVTKVRYLILGSLGGGAVGAKLTYDKWKEQWETFVQGLPDAGWLKDYINYGEILESFESIGDTFNERTVRMKDYWEEVKDFLSGIGGEMVDVGGEIIESEASPNVLSAAIFGPSEKDEEVPQAKSEERKLRAHLERAQEELLEMQQRFQREIDRLEQENKDLRKQFMLRGTARASNGRKMRRSLIDMYSDALDLLSEYDASYRIQDHLPRVVVVGDQSAGKTSVLEMIARARIFPRGAGEMMTRCPIMVTLTEGPNHIAHFKGSSHEYDLTKESDLRLLRQEVEMRMANNLKKGQTVSPDVISMYVKGPGLPRMVLVDLPGIISTVTAGMQSDTKDAISDVSKYYMSNPNAIILCVQDGSVDAERSIVTDLVNKMDPVGKRTIFVLTKTDIAEQNETNPSRIKKILSGKLFPMKAIGYFAVVTGTGSPLDSIETIRQYEEDFFRNSKLFKTGILKASQMTTQNLSFAVASCFWNMVRESIEQQGDTFKARKFNLETEWKNNYPAVRELDRDELFDKARGEILDEVLSLSQITPQQWEDIIYKNLWNSISAHAIEEIYLPSAQTKSTISFKTQIDIALKHWTDRLLPDIGVKVGWDTLLEEFSKAMQEGVEVGGRKDAHSPLFESLKARVRNECAVNHSWQTRAQDSLRVIQLTALEDTSVPAKQQWDAAIRFMEETLHHELSKTNDKLNELVGPGWQERWLYWSTRTKEQHVQNETKKELERLLQVDDKHTPILAEDEITTVKKNLQTSNIEAHPDTIMKVWKSLYREHFLDQASLGCQECRKAFFHRHLAKSELECNDVVLFWRIQRMLQSTSNALRQQIMNTEARRLENEVKQVLDDISQNLELKKQLIKGRQVDLAEELKRVRHIQDSLEQFIEALKREKTS